MESLHQEVLESLNETFLLVVFVFQTNRISSGNVFNVTSFGQETKRVKPVNKKEDNSIKRDSLYEGKCFMHSREIHKKLRQSGGKEDE